MSSKPKDPTTEDLLNLTLQVLAQATDLRVIPEYNQLMDLWGTWQKKRKYNAPTYSVVTLQELSPAFRDLAREEIASFLHQPLPSMFTAPEAVHAILRRAQEEQTRRALTDRGSAQRYANPRAHPADTQNFCQHGFPTPGPCPYPVCDGT